MNKLLASLSLLALAACGVQSNSQLAEQDIPVIHRQPIAITYGSYILVSSSDEVIDPTGCDIVLNMDIVNGRTGGSLLLKNDITGVCTVAINPDPREYELMRVEDIGCGSKRYHGVIKTTKDVAHVALTDHRERLCDDLVPNVMVLEETRRGETKTWYTPTFRSSPVDPGRFTCMAYWSGYELDPSTNKCEARGTSGCSNPFRFTTEASCKEFFRLD